MCSASFTAPPFILISLTWTIFATFLILGICNWTKLGVCSSPKQFRNHNPLCVMFFLRVQHSCSFHVCYSERALLWDRADWNLIPAWFTTTGKWRKQFNTVGMALRLNIILVITTDNIHWIHFFIKLFTSIIRVNLEVRSRTQDYLLSLYQNFTFEIFLSLYYLFLSS